MKRWNISIICLILLLFLASSCRINKYVASDEVLLTENALSIISEEKGSDKIFFNTIPVKVNEFDEKEVTSLIDQVPNSKFLGMRIKMRIYLLSNPKKDNWINRTLRKQGEAPVVFDYNKAEISSRKMKQYLETKGIFNSEVTFDTAFVSNNKLKINYQIYAPKRYQVKEISFFSENSEIQKELDFWKRYSSLKENEYYDQNVLTTERNNVVTFFRNRGYYAFNRDLVSFVVDTTQENHHLNIQLNVAPSPYTDSTIQDLSLKKFYINDMFVYIGNSSDVLNKINADSLIVDFSRDSEEEETRYTFFYEGEKIPIKPKTISQSLFFDHGDLFQLRRLEQSYVGLSDLQNFRYIDISFKQSDKNVDSKNNSPLLDAHVRLLNSKRHSFSTALELNNSPSNNSENVGNFGMEWNFTYRNKNLFRGAEIFEVRNKLAVELFNDVFRGNSKDFKEYFSTFESGLDLGVEIPRFLAPFAYSLFSRDFRPRTTINAGYNYQARNQFNRFIINSGFGYRWRKGIQHNHQLLPIEFNVVRISNISPSFQLALDTLKDARLKYQYSDHFIMDLRYNYVYNGQLNSRQRNFTYLSLSAESAGNLLYAIDKVGKSRIHDYGNGVEMYHKFGVPYSQYLRTSIDLRRYMAISSTSTLVARIFSGIGIPYGNSLSLPYEKSFYAGGPNNIRAWRMRDLGPGSYGFSSGNVFDKVGDMTIVGNIEARFPLFSIFEGALFVDAGNIWLLHESEKDFPGGAFKFDKFYKDIAIGGGIGIRANIYITTIRFDFALPFRDPTREQDRWRFDKWQWKDIVVNFGIGYPF